MSKFNQLKKLIPLGIFLGTISLGAVSVVTSYRLQKAKSIAPEKAFAGCCIEQYEPDRSCAKQTTCRDENEWYGSACGTYGQNDPWCCQDGGGGGGQQGRTDFKVYCQDPGGPTLPIANVRLEIRKFDAVDLGCDNCRGDWEWNCFRCEYQTSNPTTDSQGFTGIAYSLREGPHGGRPWNHYFQSIKVSQLPAELSYTLNSTTTLADGRQIPAGTYTIPTSQLRGPEYPSCGTCRGWTQGDCGKCPEREYSCNTPSCQSNTYSCCDAGGAFEFKYLNCFPEISPTPTPVPTATPTPEAQCERCRVYDESWNVITDLSVLQIGGSVYFATLGTTTDPAGITRARFRINGTASATWCSGTGLSIVGGWCETTLQHGEELYVPYTISSAGAHTVASMVYNPNLGWF